MKELAIPFKVLNFFKFFFPKGGVKEQASSYIIP